MSKKKDSNKRATKVASRKHNVFGQIFKSNDLQSMGCLDRAKCTIHLISAQINPVRKESNVQVNLCQKLLFLHQLTHNMSKDCSSIYHFST